MRALVGAEFCVRNKSSLATCFSWLCRLRCPPAVTLGFDNTQVKQPRIKFGEHLGSTGGLHLSGLLGSTGGCPAAASMVMTDHLALLRLRQLASMLPFPAVLIVVSVMHAYSLICPLLHLMGTLCVLALYRTYRFQFM